jgi:hypothetical protein
LRTVSYSLRSGGNYASQLQPAPSRHAYAVFPPGEYQELLSTRHVLYKERKKDSI